MTQILILDGGLGTSLEQKYGVKFGPDTPLWSSDLLVSDPATLTKCQADFARVPVNVLLTATYQASIKGFFQTKCVDFPKGIPLHAIPKYLETAYRVAEDAAAQSPSSQDVKIALSVGPYGACMVPSQEYSGNYDSEFNDCETLTAWHTERMHLFAGIEDIAARTSYVALETIPKKVEIIAMRRAFAATSQLSSLPFWISCLFPGGDGNLPDGTAAEQVVEAMLDPLIATAVPWGIGINCTKVWKLDSILRQYEATLTTLVRDGRVREWPALVLYPDGTNGEVYNTTTQTWEVKASQDDMKMIPWHEQLAAVVEATAKRSKWKQIVVGGCCMADADDIKLLRSRLIQ